MATYAPRLIKHFGHGSLLALGKARGGYRVEENRRRLGKSVARAPYLHLPLPRLPMCEETMRRTRLAEKMRRLDIEVAFSARALNQGQRAGWPHAQIGGFAKT